MEKIRMFTAKVGQMDYRSSLKQVKKYDLDEKKDDKVVCWMRRLIWLITFVCFQQEKPEWAAGQKEKTTSEE